MAEVVESGSAGSAASPAASPAGRRVGPALTRYRAIAWIVGVLLIVLFCIGLPLQFVWGHRGVDRIVGIGHGMVFYPLYLIATVDLAWRVRMPPVRLLLTLVAGTVPFASFVAERETTRWVSARL